MNAPLIILCPPRSFSSVVSTIIGEHPQLYGFPELHIFAGDTVEEVIQREAKANNPAPAGLLRTLAQEHDGIQSSHAILRAIAWLYERRDWSTKTLFDYLLDLVSPRIGVEKSPNTARNRRFLERAYTMYPNAYFLHLTRHPVSARKSIQEFWEHKQSTRSTPSSSLKTLLDSLLLWHQMHINIMDFTRTLPVGQTMRIKGEDLLSYPQVYLPQITEWMGIRSDEKAIAAMMHPENSPYACVGPSPARGGNDPKFMRSPKMRHGKVKEPSLQQFFEQNLDLQWVAAEVQDDLAETTDFPALGQDLVQKVTQLAHVMGYQ
ncbi:MAG TPA: sulfotransferase [Leptolyngbyaceae cyanobacterium]